MVRRAVVISVSLAVATGASMAADCLIAAHLFAWLNVGFISGFIIGKCSNRG